MSQTQYATRPKLAFSYVTNFIKPAETRLSTIVYRSRAKAPLRFSALRELAELAQQRNRIEDITGLMVYDFPCFYQWLEGPEASIERIMHSISRDPRHMDLEILSAKPIEQRVFSGWDMKLATRRDIVYPRLETVRELRRHPEAAPALLKTMAPQERTAQRGTPRKRDRVSQSAAMLESLIRTSVIPELLQRHGAAALFPAPLILEKQSTELAGLLLAAEPDSALNLIREQIGRQRSAVPLYATLLEPAARRLGDLWLADSCSEFDMTIALSHLQSAVRLLGTEFLQHPLHPEHAPHVLVVPLPGELHSLGAALNSEAMWHEGWSPQSEFPTDNAALQRLLKADWFDVLDLTLSVALQREHWLPRLAETIRLARRESRNPGLIVMVGGRLFADEAATGTDVAANGSSATASHITGDILRVMAARKGQRSTAFSEEKAAMNF
jgi:methanogenic corrinoid protein MtbC1